MDHANLIVYENINQCLTLKGVADKKGKHTTEEDLGIIENASAVVDGAQDKFVWIGKAGEMPEMYDDVVNRYSSDGEIWLPELVECHTHLIYGGHRHRDYALRCKGKTYQEIAAGGGGILTTIQATRETSLSDLKEAALVELERFQKYGVGVVEIKTGYGLSLESELKLLDCIEELRNDTSVRLVATFMPAHAVPPEFKGRGDDYVKAIVEEWIPEAAKRENIAFFDVFIEEGFFSVEQARKLCIAAKEVGFGIKLHVDQFKDLGGIELAIEMGAVSVDHLDHTSEANIQKIAQTDTVAVLLPGASLFTGTPYPAARKLIDAGARVALSTDFNPGTCPTRNLPLMTTIACSQMKMTIAEAIAGITYNAAAALGVEDTYGSLQVGRPFRVCQLKAESYEVLPYSFGELD